MPDDQTRLIAALRRPDAYPHETGTIDVVETHISYVFLTGRFAYKVKKAISLPFVDFSTLRRRERFCRDELTLNRRLAPDLYLDVVPIGFAEGRLRIGAEPAIEYAVRMRQFPGTALADALVRSGQLTAAELEALAGSLARFHATLPQQHAPDAAARIERNLAELETLANDAPGAGFRGDGTCARQLAPVAARLRQALAERGERLQARADAGFVRECHGDLHLGNIVLLDDRLVPFDCLEFDRDLRTIDVIDEAAFLHVDLLAHRRPDLAFAFVNRYLETTGDYAGLGVFDLYTAHRALVRAKVSLLTQARAPDAKHGSHARNYLAVAAQSLAGAQRCLLITHGLTGSGKTTVAREVARSLPCIQVRSDVERKRLHALAPTARTGAGIDQGIYSATASAATYDHLAAAARAALSGGSALLVDAAFLDGDERDRFRRIAARANAPFLILSCTARESTLAERIRSRAAANRDASDASLDVLQHQLATADALTADERRQAIVIDTEEPRHAEALAAAILGRIQPSLSSTSY